MYDVTLGHVQVTCVVQKQQVINVMSVCILAVFTWHANIISASYYIVICDLSGSIMFFHVIP